jgi:cytidylate kinase
MIISLSGALGSGKSSIAQMLAEKLGWPHYNMGGLQREIAAKKGLTLAEHNKLCQENPAVDREVDEYQKEMGKTKDNFIIEGRISWYFIPQALKIYLYVNEEIGAKRIYGNLRQKKANNERRNEDKGLNSWQDVLESTRHRLANENQRWLNYYHVDVGDKSNYDLYLDTTNMTQDEVFTAVYNYVQTNIDKGKV